MEARAMATFTGANVTPLTKQIVHDLQSEFGRTSPFLAKVPKQKRAYGAINGQDPIRVAGAERNASATYNARVGDAQWRRFDVPRRQQTVHPRITHEVYHTVYPTEAAVADALKEELDAAYTVIQERVSMRLWRPAGATVGDGSIGRVNGAGPAGNVITLATASDVRYFKLDMALEFSTAQGGGTVKAATAAPVVTQVSFTNGTVTVNDIATVTPVAVAANDWIFPAGDYDLCIAGVPAWIPLAAPGAADNFFGVNRSAYEPLLAGCRTTAGSGGPISNNILIMSGVQRQTGGRMTDVFMSTTNWATLVRERQGQALERDAKFGFRSITVETDTGPAMCWGEPYMPDNIIVGGDMSKCFLGYANRDGDDYIITESGIDGQIWRWVGQAGTRNDWEALMAFYGNMYITEPRSWVIGQV